MIMTEKLANTLMDCLASLAISANLENGMPTDEDMDLVIEYAQKKFLELTAEWEELTGEEWRIEESE